MNLIKDKWIKKDENEFYNYLESMSRPDKINWTKNILNTNMEVLAIKTPDLVFMAKEINKGDYFSFLDLEINNYYENTVINGKLITKIKEFDVLKEYLDRYAEKVDNWSSCDLLKFNVKNNEEKFFNLAIEYSNSELTFVRRIGMYILFKFIDNDYYVDKVYDMLNKFCNEKEYYVNMMNSWLVCELFIKRRDKTIKFLQNNMLNKFTINKAISKCRDSFRVSLEDKDFLLNFRR